MDPGDQTFSLSDFLCWTNDALGDFLCKRGLSKEGTKQELVALCFAAGKMNLPVLPSLSETLKTNKQQYYELLKIDTSVSLPDPLHLYSDWYDESSGISKWPPIYLTDITSFLVSYESTENVKKHLNDYKIGKAYSYYQSNWLKEVFYHDIEKASVHCFLRARCIPSQRLNDEAHTVWICARKDSGEIKSAYCSCTAGLGQTCNHVAGLLFRVEAANKLGITSCTAVPCTWNVPQSDTLKPTKIIDLDIKKSRYGKPAKTRPLVAPKKRDFKPVSDQPTGKDILTTFAKELRETLPNACFYSGLDIINEETVSQPDSKKDLDEKFEIADMIQKASESCSSVDPNTILQHLTPLSLEDVASINLSTCGQNINPAWHKMRDGRITSSNFYSVYTRVSTSLLKPDCDITPLLGYIMGYNHLNPNMKALKYGREMEPIARQSYTEEYRKNGHSEVSFTDCGLFIDIDNPYLAASPDVLVACRCCGLGMAELKCPLIPQCNVCQSFCCCNLPSCLHYVDGIIKMKKNHSYYAQIQGQLAITGRKWCDLYIYTCNGSFTERVMFDFSYYQGILSHTRYFFLKYVIPEIISRDLKKSVGDNSVDMYTPPVNSSKGSVYFCPVCKKQIKESSASVYTYKDHSIECEKCLLWYHFQCVKMTIAKAKKLSNWLCSVCK